MHIFESQSNQCVENINWLNLFVHLVKVHEGLQGLALIPWAGSQGRAHKFRVKPRPGDQVLAWRPHLSKQAKFSSSWSQAALHVGSCQGPHIKATGATEAADGWLLAPHLANWVASSERVRLEDRKYFQIFMNTGHSLPIQLMPIPYNCSYHKKLQADTLLTLKFYSSRIYPADEQIH